MLYCSFCYVFNYSSLLILTLMAITGCAQLSCYLPLSYTRGPAVLNSVATSLEPGLAIKVIEIVTSGVYLECTFCIIMLPFILYLLLNLNKLIKPVWILNNKVIKHFGILIESPFSISIIQENKHKKGPDHKNCVNLSIWVILLLKTKWFPSDRKHVGLAFWYLTLQVKIQNRREANPSYYKRGITWIVIDAICHVLIESFALCSSLSFIFRSSCSAS